MVLTRLLLISFAVVLVFGQSTRTDPDPACNVACRNIGETCGGINPFNACQNRAYCDSTSKCALRAVLGGACGGSNPASCYDSTYSVACVSSKCVYTNAFGPGEGCRSGDTNFDSNGGCRAGLTCTGSICVTALNSGQSCATAPLNCAVGLYCKAGTCASLENTGSSCTGITSCKPVDICTTRGGSSAVCNRRYSQSIGSGCDSFYDCNAGSWCDPVARKCVSNPAGQGCKSGGSTSCNTTAGEFCQCDYSCGSPNNQQSAVNRDLNLRQCIQDNNCFGPEQNLLSYAPGNCYNSKCSSHFPSNDGDSCSSSSSTIILSFAVIALALFLALF